MRSQRTNDNTSHPIHCAMLGDGMIGKTCLTLSYSTKRFTDEYTATIHDDYKVKVQREGKDFPLSVFDTAGQSDFEDLRVFTYQESEVLVLCFSVCDRDSFASVFNSWIPEIKRHMKKKRPIILVGTQTDMRAGNTVTEVSREEGKAMAKLIGAVKYVECSAKDGSGVSDVFGQVLGCALKKRKRNNSFLGRIFQR